MNSILIKTKERNIAIDILKIFAVFLVLNSHMGKCYESYSFMATGGAIGDALFFFASGFTLFLGRNMRFDNWYKRRISRIYPTILAVGILTAIIWHSKESFWSVITSQRYWFLSCILVYYIILYPIKTYISSLKIFFCILCLCILAIYYLFFDYTDKGIFYGYNDFRLFFYFLFMLQGAIMGKNYSSYVFKKRHIIMLLVCIFTWYLSLYFLNNNSAQIVSAIPLLGITYYTYLVSCGPWFKNLYNRKFLGNILFIIGNLCLEIYMIQFYIITDKLNMLFPLNIPILMFAIILFAYLVKCLSEFILQTFNSEPYNWGKMLLRK